MSSYSPSIDAVFISDLHLNPNEPDIQERFQRFVKWAALHTKSVYILGDFFHVWAGDDSLDEWSESIASELSWLAGQGVSLFYIHGNRDFLIGNDFAKRASLQILPDPTVINCNGQRVLLTHGDQYCSNDRGHQWLRRITRNRLFSFVFLRIPYHLRSKWVNQMRQQSERNKRKPMWSMDIVPSTMLLEMSHMHADIVIHGHIHQPGLTHHSCRGRDYRQYVLSDWDDNPKVLCYYISKGFSFILLAERCNA